LLNKKHPQGKSFFGYRQQLRQKNVNYSDRQFKETIMLKTIILFILSVSFSHAGFFSDLIGGGSKSDPEPTPSRSGVVSPVPAKHDGKVVQFQIESAKVEDYIPAKGEEAAFNIIKDTPNFVNFASVSVVDGKIIRKRDVNGGTCFGIAYFTHMWFSRITEPVLSGNEPVLLKEGNHKITLIDRLFGRNSDKTGTSYDDGVSFAVAESVKQAEAEGKTSPFNTEAISNKPDDIRLKPMSLSDYNPKILLGAIAHHGDQSSAGRKFIDAAKPRKCEQGVDKLKELLLSHKTQTILFRRFHVGEKWYQWSKLAWGHAVLLHRISKVKTKGTDGVEREAWKLHFADANFRYTNNSNVDSGEGFGTYLLYFPETKQLTFSKKAQNIYKTAKTKSDGTVIQEPLLTISSFIDDKEVKFGYYDIWEGHSKQQKLAKSRFLDAAVGKGRVLTAEEEAIINEKGQLELSENTSMIMNDDEEPMTEID
jgi:hypothetical protein